MAAVMQRFTGTLFVLLLAAAAAAQEAPPPDADALAKELSNPVASLISVPLQLNWDDGLGRDDEGNRFLLNIQPVIPVSLNARWNMISRTILPVIDQSDVVPGTGSQSGIGDIVQSLFFSPKAPTARGWIWGAGPVLLLATATDDLLGADQWGVGPSAVVLKQTASGATVGALVNHIVSVAGNDERADVNATFIQPFFSQALGKGRTLSFNFEATYDWEGEQWTVPFNVLYGKVTKVGKQLLSVGGGGRYYVEAPESGAEWGLRFIVTLLYPR